VEEVEGSKAELWVEFGRLWCGGELAWPWQGWRWCCSSKKAVKEEER
jgi:hypothetical protein